MHVDKSDRMEPIKYRFYQKPVANKALVDCHSAMPIRMKISTLVEEGTRRLRNTSPSLHQGEIGDLMREFNVRMIQAGYSQDFRYRITKRALDKYRSLQEGEREGKT